MAEARVTAPGQDTHDTLRAVADLLDVGVVAVDRDLGITVWNRWLETASGMTAVTLVGQPLATLVPDMLQPAGEKAFARVLKGATEVHSHRLHRFLLRLPAPADYRTFEQMQQSARITPLTAPDGTVVGAAAFIVDVTERVAREDELRAATLAAQQANQAKSEFLAAMSHELRTPIGAISGYADLLIEGIIGTVTEPQREKLQRIKSVGDHLLRIVDQILAFARLEARREAPEMSNCDVAVVMREAFAAVEPLARRKGLELVLTEPGKPLFACTDATKVRQILINLLGNAVKFTDRGSIAIESVASADPKSLAIRVRDTGRGIAPADHERIFEPFVQARSSFSRTHEGTGLGLAVSRELARILGGDIAVTSQVGAGSTFIVTLPTSPSAAGK